MRRFLIRESIVGALMCRVMIQCSLLRDVMVQGISLRRRVHLSVRRIGGPCIIFAVDMRRSLGRLPGAAPFITVRVVDAGLLRAFKVALLGFALAALFFHAHAVHAAHQNDRINHTNDEQKGAGH